MSKAAEYRRWLARTIWRNGRMWEGRRIGYHATNKAQAQIDRWIAIGAVEENEHGNIRPVESMWDASGLFIRENAQ